MGIPLRDSAIILKYNRFQKYTLHKNQGPRLPQPDNILILRLSPFCARPNTSTISGKFDVAGRRRRYLYILSRLLKLLGYKFTVLTEALASRHGKYAAIAYDEPNSYDLKRESPLLEGLRLKATVFISTADDSIDWNYLKSLCVKGWEIGTLGQQITDLTEKSQIEQKQLILTAKHLIANELGQAPTVFAYPFGAYDATTVSCLRDAGFIAGVTMKGGINRTESTADFFHLCRLNLTGSLRRDVWLLLKNIFFSCRAKTNLSIQNLKSRTEAP